MMQQEAKAQSAMEYLTTYLWVIILVAIVLAAMYWLGVFNALQPRAPPGGCYVYRFGGPLSISQVDFGGICGAELPQFVFVSKGIGDFAIINSSVQRSSGLNISNNITITAWVEPFGSPYHDVVDKEAQYGMKLNYNNYPHSCSPSNSVDFCLEWDTSNSWSGVSYPIPSAVFNNWTFIAVSINYGVYKYWYANGNLIGNQIVTSNVPSTSGSCSQYATAVPLAIGSDVGTLPGTAWTNAGCFPGYGGFNGQEAEWFNGSLSNVQIYNASLTANQINSIYLSGIGGAPALLKNLVGWWPLNGNDNDYSGDGNNGATYNGYYSGGQWSQNYAIP